MYFNVQILIFCHLSGLLVSLDILCNNHGILSVGRLLQCCIQPIKSYLFEVGLRGAFDQGGFYLLTMQSKSLRMAYPVFRTLMFSLSPR